MISMKPLTSLSLLTLAVLTMNGCQTVEQPSFADSPTYPVYDYDSETAPVKIGAYEPGPGESASDYPSYQSSGGYTPPAYNSAPVYQSQAPAYSAPQYAGAETYAPAPMHGGSHTVAPGDTLFAISRRHNTTVDAIKAANGLSSDIIKVGEVLAIP